MVAVGGDATVGGCQSGVVKKWKVGRIEAVEDILMVCIEMKPERWTRS